MSADKPNEEMNLEDGSFRNNYVDLLSERLGGRAIACSNDWFAGCDNLVKLGRGVFDEGAYVSSGKLMDGWESRRGFRRRNNDGKMHQNDWCVLRMGAYGRVRVLEIDTNHFRGNSPEQISVQAAKLDGEPDAATVWTNILGKVDVIPDSQNVFRCNNNEAWTHLKLNIFPDGGVARFRAYGNVVVKPESFVEGEPIDLASMRNGANGIAASDMFFCSPSNLTLPDRAINMGDGWETKRRRDEHNDWAIIRLGLTGTIRKVIIDTSFFKGNYPDCASLDAINIDQLGIKESQIEDPSIAWQSVISSTSLFADKEHLFIEQLKIDPSLEFTHVRLNIFPDGGISRLRVYGFPNWQDYKSVLKNL